MEGSGHKRGQGRGREREGASFCFVYMTAPSLEAARRIADALVAERLAACVNLFSGMESVYRWQGRVERGAEVALIAKTTGALAEAVTLRVLALHGESCPCVAVIPVAPGHEGFFAWIARQTRGEVVSNFTPGEER